MAKFEKITARLEEEARVRIAATKSRGAHLGAFSAQIAVNLLRQLTEHDELAVLMCDQPVGVIHLVDQPVHAATVQRSTDNMERACVSSVLRPRHLTAERGMPNR